MPNKKTYLPRKAKAFLRTKKGKHCITQGEKKLLLLPKTALNFIEAIKPMLKASTLKNYLCHLRHFHAWLASKNLALCKIDRTQMEQWLKAICDGRLNVESRRTRIIRIRRYLIWLSDKEMIIADPDNLLRTSDLPKLPSRLPRPFSPEADRQIQERFAASSSIYCQALLLMRHTGIRIGELARLEYQCLENDHNGNAFLKVPLGKLDNERLVPLAPETRRLLEKIQQQTFKNAPYLLTPQHARSTLECYLKKALKKATEGLDIPGPVVSHRLRHTYATQLLNAGMSLVSIMKLLGHRSFRMTLIYAAITQETVVKDYHIALKKI